MGLRPLILMNLIHKAQRHWVLSFELDLPNQQFLSFPLPQQSLVVQHLFLDSGSGLAIQGQPQLETNLLSQQLLEDAEVRIDDHLVTFRSFHTILVIYHLSYASRWECDSMPSQVDLSMNMTCMRTLS